MIVAKQGLGFTLWAPTMQEMQTQIIALKGYVAQLNNAITASAVDDAWKQQWYVFAKEFDIFTQNAATTSGILNADDMLVQMKDYRARTQYWSNEFKKRGGTPPGPIPNVGPSTTETLLKYGLIALGIVTVGAVAYGFATKQGPVQIINRIAGRGRGE